MAQNMVPGASSRSLSWPMDVATLPLRPVVTCNLSPRPVPVLSLYPVQIMYILYFFILYIISLCYIYIYIYMHICILSYFSLCEILYIYVYTHTCIYMYDCTFPKLAMTCRNGDRKTQYSDPLQYICPLEKKALMAA